MNFHQIREIIKNIKERLTCTSCESNFSNEDIYILSAVAEKCVILINCHECSNPIIVTATVNSKQTVLGDSITEMKVPVQDVEEADLVTTDDVLEIHSFLKDFNGDFKNAIKLETK